MTRASKNYQQRIWEQLHATPNKTSTELGILMGVEQATVSHYLTQLFRRKMVERKHRTWINDNARQQTNFEYSAVGTKYAVRPVTLIPAHPRKPYAVHAQERRDAAAAAAEATASQIKWKDILTPVPVPVPVPVPLPLDYDIENMTVKQARALREQLNNFFGGGK